MKKAILSALIASLSLTAVSCGLYRTAQIEPGLMPGTDVSLDGTDELTDPEVQTSVDTPHEATFEETVTFVSGSPEATETHKPYEPPVLDKLPEDMGYSEGLYFDGNGSNMIFIDNYGPCTMSRAEASVSFEGLTDGDMIKVGHQLVMETYPGQMPVYTVEKLSDGEFSDLDRATLAHLAGMGYVELSKIVGDIRYIRTDGYNELFEFPYLVAVTSRDELDAYYSAFSSLYSLGSREKIYSDTTEGFADAITKYDDAYFEENMLYMAVLEEGSGSVRHKVKALSGGSLIIDSVSPEVCTDDMAEWHILVELPIGVELWGVNQGERVYSVEQAIKALNEH